MSNAPASPSPAYVNEVALHLAKLCDQIGTTINFLVNSDQDGQIISAEVLADLSASLRSAANTIYRNLANRKF